MVTVKPKQQKMEANATDGDCKTRVIAVIRSESVPLLKFEPIQGENSPSLNTDNVQTGAR